MLGGKKIMMSAEEKLDVICKLQLERDERELQNLGNYEPINDSDSISEQKEMLEHSNYLYTESTGASKHVY